MQKAVTDLLGLGPKLTDDLDESQLDAAMHCIDALSSPLAEDDIEALMTLLPAGGDTAYGLNWSIVHALEAAPAWPRWDLLTDTGNEWVQRLRQSLFNGGHAEPATS